MHDSAAVATRNLITALAFATLSLAACETTAPSEPATFEARWANQEWRGDARAVHHGVGLTIGGTHPLDAGQLPNSSVHVVTAATAPGTYQLGAGDAEFYYYTGGDVLAARYLIPEGGSGTLTIETITDSSVTGSVMFGAVSQYSYRDPPVGHRAIFEGTFSARIQHAPATSSTNRKPSGAVH